MKPKISIVVPVYNSATFLPETIDSVLNQTFQNWELILVNDGSTDNSKEICESYMIKDSRIKVLNKENGGQGSARNLGVSKSYGDLIAFLDADDIWTSNKLEHQLSILNKDSEIDIIYSSGWTFSHNGDQLQNIKPWLTGFQKGEDLVRKIYQHNGIINSSVLVKKELVDHHQFDERRIIQGSEDYDLWLDLAINNFVFYGDNERVIKYRVHNGGIHLNTIKMLEGKEQIYLKYLDNEVIPPFIRKKQFRFIYREWIRQLTQDGHYNTVKDLSKRLYKQDPFSCSTISQKLISWLPARAFARISVYVIFRVAYTLEGFMYHFKR